MTSFPRHIFKKYDIRGLVGQEITDDLAEKIGQVFADFRSRELGERSFTCVVGRDMRESSVHLQDALMRGLTQQGVSVLNVGLVSTPAFYFSIGHLNADAGVMVSASHNPPAYNGFKLTRENAVPVSGDTGIEEIAQMVQIGFTGSIGPIAEIKRISGIPEVAAKAEFDHAGSHPIKRFKIVADAANGMGAQYLDELFKLIDADVTRMYWDFNGSFPNHEADPFKPENTVDLQNKVCEFKADIGIATDGDGDRIFFVDDTGERVEAAIIRGLLAQIILRSQPGATICYDVRPGRITEEMILQAGGKPSVTRAGHSLIKEQMRKDGAIFGGESSGHLFYAFPQGVYEGPVTVTTAILQEMTRQNKSLSQIVFPFMGKYFHSGELSFEVHNMQEVIARIKERCSDGELDELDGISITYPTFWFNVRGSNTEPKLRLNLESVDRKTMEEKRDEISQMITNV